MKIDIIFKDVSIQEMNELKEFFGDKLVLTDLERELQSLSGRISMSLSYRNLNMRFFEEIERMGVDIIFPDIKKVKIESLDFSPHINRCLHSISVSSVEDLIRKTPREIYDTKGIGRKSLILISAKLFSYGLSLTVRQQNDSIF